MKKMAIFPRMHTLRHATKWQQWSIQAQTFIVL